MNERLSIARIAEIQQRAEAATPGPWSTHEDWPGRVFSDGNPNYLHIARTTGWNAEANERFIAHAREDVPALLAELSTVRAELRVARGRVAELEVEREKLVRWHGEDGKTINRLVARDERRRAELVALRNDALSMRGLLAPADSARKVPFPLGETLTPAVEWLIARVSELEAERHTTNEALDDAVQALREVRDRNVEQTRYAAHLEAEICQCQPELESGEYMHEATCPVAGIQMRTLGCPGFEGNPVAPDLCAGCHEPRENHASASQDGVS